MVEKTKDAGKSGAFKGGKPRKVTVKGKSFKAQTRITKLNRPPVTAPQKPKV